MRYSLWQMSLVCLLLMLGFSSPQAQSDTYLQYPIIDEPNHLNPFLSNTIASNTIVRNIVEGLTQGDPVTGDILPALADSWIIRSLDDGRQVFTFNLKQGIQYHQLPDVLLTNTEITADDIVWNYKLGLHPDSSISERASSLRFIEGAEAYQQAVLEAGDNAPHVLEDVDLAGVQALDDYTVQITLSAPDRLFLIEGNIGIISPEAYRQLGENFARMPIGAGPYQIDSWDAGEQIVLRANPTYFNSQLPRNDGLVFRLYDDETAILEDYRTGNVDVLLNFPPRERDTIIEEFNDEFFDREGLHVRYWGFNMATGFLSQEPLVRQAFAHALDRDTAWLDLAQGARLPANQGLLPPSMPASNPACVYPYDLERSADLLAEAGYLNGEGLPSINIHVLEPIANEPQVELWGDALISLGVDVNFIIEDSSTYWDSIVQDDTMIFQNGWSSGIVDPSAIFDFLILDGNGSMRYNNPDINDLLREARIELELDVRTVLYQEVHNTIMCEVVIIPSAYSRVSWLQQPWIDAFVPGGGGAHTAPLWNVIINR